MDTCLPWQFHHLAVHLHRILQLGVTAVQPPARDNPRMDTSIHLQSLTYGLKRLHICVVHLGILQIAIFCTVYKSSCRALAYQLHLHLLRLRLSARAGQRQHCARSLEVITPKTHLALLSPCTTAHKPGRFALFTHVSSDELACTHQCTAVHNDALETT